MCASGAGRYSTPAVFSNGGRVFACLQAKCSSEA